MEITGAVENTVGFIYSLKVAIPVVTKGLVVILDRMEIMKTAQ